MIRVIKQVIAGILQFLLPMMLSALTVNAQKVSIDNNSHEKWEALGEVAVSNSGQYFFYAHEKGGDRNIIVLKNMRGDVVDTFQNTSRAMFSFGGTELIIHFSNTVFGIYNIESKRMKLVDSAISLSPIVCEKEEKVLYQKSDTLFLYGVSTHSYEVVEKVKSYIISPDRRTVILWDDNKLRQMDVWKCTVAQVHEGKVSHPIFSPNSETVAFLALGDKCPIVYYYKTSFLKSKRFVNLDSNRKFDNRCVADEELVFSKDSRILYFKAEKKTKECNEESRAVPDVVEIWHWRDTIPMAQQVYDLKGSRRPTLWAATNLNNEKILTISEEGKELVGGFFGSKYVLLRTVTSRSEAYYNPDQIPNYWLKSLSNGEMREFRKKVFEIDYETPVLSPNEEYVSWWEEDELLVYSIKENKIDTVTRGLRFLPRNLFSMRNAQRLGYRFRRQYRWLKNDEGIVLMDGFDIWLLAPAAQYGAVCVTKNYGRRHKVRFDFADKIGKPLEIALGASVILIGQQLENQKMAYFRINLSRKPNLVPGVLADVRYRGYPISVSGDKYLVTRESASKSPNLFLTTDFRDFSQVSNISPESSYNWMSSEVVNWRTFDSKTGLGLLYKPEDFDPGLRYPIIFYCYQDEVMESANRYLTPSPASGPLNIPWFVSNGYLVCIPNIDNLIPGKISESIYNTVVPLALSMRKLHWIDANRMGLQGHSFGGYVVNTLITRSNLFAAASSVAGISDIVSLCGDLAFGSKSLLIHVERGQFNIGATPWLNPELFLENSPIFGVGNITTPLLLTHNRGDDNAPFKQSVEMFNAMRRAQKPVWLLQYDGQGHALFGQASLDFTVRQQEFFDHFLKGQPPKSWLQKSTPLFKYPDRNWLIK